MASTDHGLAALFEPRSIAVVGASAAPEKAGHQLLRALDGFPGPLYAVNPRGGEILGRPVSPAVSAIDASIDLALLVVPPPACPDALRDCARAGVRAAVVHAGGFAEAGEQGAALQDELAAIAREAGIRLLGPNTSGFANPVAEVWASFVPAVSELPPGRVAIVAQSGGVNHALAFLALQEGLGLRLAVGLGNAVDVDAVDVLGWLADDVSTAAVALHVEGVADGRALVAAVERVAARKPIAALKVGRADVDAFSRSHTGALTGSWRLTRAALAQAGAVVVEDTEELIDAVRALSLVRLPPQAAPGVGVVTGQAGPGLLIADALGSSGVRIPELAPATRERLAALLPPLTYQRNPVDTGRPEQDAFGAVLRAVADDPAVDVLLTYALHEPGALDLAAAPGRAGVAVPVVVGSGGPPEAINAVARDLEAVGVPLFRTPERAARAVRALVRDAAAADRRGGAPLPVSPAAPLGPGPVSEDDAKRLLEEVGLRAPRRRVCASRDEARAAAEALGGRVVVKVLEPVVAHKTEVGGVHVGVAPGPALEVALDAIDALGQPGGRVRYLVEELLPGGVDLIVGGVRDGAFGPAVLVGVGGVAAEALEDVSMRLAPLSVAEAADMIADLAGRRLLEGFRGLPVVDRDELARALVVIGGLLAAHPEIAELDVNPLRATPDGLVVADALVVLTPQAGSD